jgi:hypothetical protein
MAKRSSGDAAPKASKSEIVTIRLEPKLRYLAEIAARKHRRSLSSYVEWAIEASLAQVEINVLLRQVPCVRPIRDVSDELWDVDEPERFVKLAIQCPELLNHQEQVLWKLLRENPRVWESFWRYSDGKRIWTPSEDSLNTKALRKFWSVFWDVAHDDQPRSALPLWAETKAQFDPAKEEDAEVADAAPTLDEKIPF